MVYAWIIRVTAPAYAELAVTTNFSFLRGASHPEELVAEAARLGLSGIGIADHNSLAGIVRAHVAHKETGAREAGLQLVVGARLVFSDGTPDILAYPENRAAYARLSKLLSLGKRRAEKGSCILTIDDLLIDCGDLLFIVMPSKKNDAITEVVLNKLTTICPNAVWLGVTIQYKDRDRSRTKKSKAIAKRHRVKIIAINDVLYHSYERRQIQDVLSCIREHTTIDKIGKKLEHHAERYLKSTSEMARLFRKMPEAIEETIKFLNRVKFSLDELRYEYPDEPIPEGKTAQEHLADLTWEGAERRYNRKIPDLVKASIYKELKLIKELDYAPYFLTVNDIVAFARSRRILCQGRGSAANSVICFCLGITSVDPTEINLLFERFISAERLEPPDIDVDFEHERREEVIQWIYKRYGRERAGLAATVISYRPRSAIRDVGNALGLTEDVTAALANTVWGSWGSEISDTQIKEAGLDPTNQAIHQAVSFAVQIQGFPRHLSQHVGGFILTRDRLDETVPIGNAAMEDRTFIEWDKDDISALGLMKIDILALGILTCIRKVLDLIAQHGGPQYDLATIPREDAGVYAMLQRADSIGVFQVESRAQMNMLPRIKPKCFYDIVIQVAIVRPGPIQGDMVHPYLRRRQGKEKIYFPSPSPEHGEPNELERVLGKTLGVPLFQEQAMRIAIEAAKFTPEEANKLRRAMATFRRVGTIGLFQKKMIDGMVRRGYENDFAERCFKQIEGFGEYGFPESHAASFALLVYASAWLKCYHPAAFAAGLLNSQPMGFYGPAQIVRDASEHHVEVKEPDVNMSRWDATLEEKSGGELSLRLGFRQINGFRENWSDRITTFRNGFYPSPEMIQRRANVPKAALVLLAEADAMRSISLDRREASWHIRRLPDAETLPLFEHADAKELAEEPTILLPSITMSEHIVADYQTLGLSIKGHPMMFLRNFYEAEGAVSCYETKELVHGKRAKVAGVVLIRQKPGSAKGVVFMTIEDETGIANLVIWPSLLERFRKVVMGARLVCIDGIVQRSDEGIIHIVIETIYDRSSDLLTLSDEQLPTSFARADEVKKPIPEGRARHPRNVSILPKSRDFH
ncbi:MAG: error-prone DNA polymerase [Beijerinckiaceae bacterium]|nr:error-prone DNA polymerase [Beijerinckiaceae bacterium]NDB67602.1 error-prone DNA polymerase [Methylocystaceae bacterium]